MLACNLGQGLTVYVTGSRETVTGDSTPPRKPKPKLNGCQTSRATTIWRETKKPRSRVLHGETSRISTPLGPPTSRSTTTATSSRSKSSSRQPRRAATRRFSEAIGRLISYNLRLASPVSPRDRLKEVVNQLSGIGGGAIGLLGRSACCPLPDGVAQVLAEFLDRSAEETLAHHANGRNGHARPRPVCRPPAIVGDLCPDCGNSSLVNEEGCRKCNSCGWRVLRAVFSGSVDQSIETGY